jgi:hypothetical protein
MTGKRVHVDFLGRCYSLNYDNYSLYVDNDNDLIFNNSFKDEKFVLLYENNFIDPVSGKNKKYITRLYKQIMRYIDCADSNKVVFLNVEMLSAKINSLGLEIYKDPKTNQFFLIEKSDMQFLQDDIDFIVNYDYINDYELFINCKMPDGYGSPYTTIYSKINIKAVLEDNNNIAKLSVMINDDIQLKFLLLKYSFDIDKKIINEYFRNSIIHYLGILGYSNYIKTDAGNVIYNPYGIFN